MSSSLEVEKKTGNGIIIFALKGQIDEDSDFEQIAIEENEKIIFDLEEITLINSCGIRDWVAFQAELPSNLEITYKRCPQVIIEQLNIIKGFIREGAKIESFYAPYFNADENEEVKILLTPDEVKDCKAPVKTSDKGVELEFDEIELQYFNFLKNK